MNHRTFIISIAIAIFFASSICAWETSESPEIDFTSLSLEELKTVEIISASKKPESPDQVAMATYVITREEILRSGATSIPEALKLAPGVQVARISPTEWAVTIRGLNQEFSNNLLVLVDGRSVYTPVFSGVHWDVQDTILEDIERIEVIRGPGAAVWGANAVNGVINIITRNARDTQGGQIVASTGKQESSASVRYGDRIDDRTFYRVYAKFFNRDQFEYTADSIEDVNQNDWESLRSGFRIDWSPETAKGDDSITVQGEVYSNQFKSETTLLYPLYPYQKKQNEISRAKGGNIIGQWRKAFSEFSDITVQMYYDYAKRDYRPNTPADGIVETTDLEIRHRFSPHFRHDIVWGFGYRYIHDNFSVDEKSYQFQSTMNPASLNQHIYNAFLKDDIQILPNRLTMTIGAKLEYHNDTELEVQPTLRLLWMPEKQHTFWGAVSSAVRTPSRMERHLDMAYQVVAPQDRLPTDLPELGLAEGDPLDKPITIKSIGNDNLESEELISYEAGYRWRPGNTMQVDASAFYYEYENLISNVFGTPFVRSDPVPHYVIPIYFSNDSRGEAYGVELSVGRRLLPWWRLSFSYNYLKTHIFNKIGEDYIEFEDDDRANPRNQFALRNMFDIGNAAELDIWIRHTDKLYQNDIDPYTTLDVRLAFKPLDKLEISVVGQNLIEQSHQEFSSFEVERNLYLKITGRF